MSEPHTVSAAVRPAPNIRRRLALSAATLIFAGAGAAYGWHWWSIARFETSTDDAYVAGNVIQVTPQVEGTVVAVNADDTDFVTAGQTLVVLDDTDARLALDQAKAALAETVRDVRAMFSADGAQMATVNLQETNLTRLTEDLARRQRLADTGAVSAEELKHARDAVTQAQAQLARARKEQEASRALTDNTSLAGHPRVARAAAQLRAAYLSWRRTRVPAPVGGQVARRAVQVGQRPQPGAPLMAVVPLDQVWVDANFKEGQLRDMRIGQPVTLTADLWGDQVVYHGRVVGFSAGTGAAFSLLPAQNATGNWIKVVQRLPVRIALQADELRAHPLRVGLSMEATVTVKDTSGPQLSQGRQKDVVAATAVYADLDAEADRVIADTIAHSAGGQGGAGRANPS